MSPQNKEILQRSWAAFQEAYPDCPKKLQAKNWRLFTQKCFDELPDEEKIVWAGRAKGEADKADAPLWEMERVKQDIFNEHLESLEPTVFTFANFISSYVSLSVHVTCHGLQKDGELGVNM